MRDMRLGHGKTAGTFYLLHALYMTIFQCSRMHSIMPCNVVASVVFKKFERDH